VDAAAPVGAALALAVASGLSLYGAAFVTGLALRLGAGPLWPAAQGLVVLADPVVLTVSGVLFTLEFLADKVPGLDSVWDVVHTAIRPIGGALLAIRALGELSLPAETAALLLLGAAALTTHAAKATTRLVVNASPEPVTNVGLSLTENGVVAAVVWLALVHPLAALVAGLVVLTAAVWLIAWLTHRAGLAARRLRARLTRRAPARRGD
jgi:hypothetical protein